MQQFSQTRFYASINGSKSIFHKDEVRTFDLKVDD